jgi:RNA polymerase sigma-70 factor, ECF subfamily
VTEPGARLALEAAYRGESRRVLATLVRLLGDFDAAEEALHEAFAAAAEQWPREGVPANPGAWLISAGRFKTIDRWRREGRSRAIGAELAAARDSEVAPSLPEAIPDDELRLIFTCCHPALAPDARIALTLREVAGLTTEEIARAYLVATPAIAQRIVRAKAKIRHDALPYEVPGPAELPARLESVLSVLYLVFNEGYAATASAELVRSELCGAAIRMGERVVELLPEPEALGLLALMLLHHARREARVDAAGDLVLLEQQDRGRWDRAAIARAQALIERALERRHVGPFLLQAAIASLHAEARSSRETDWAQIVALYDVLARIDPSPVVALNRAVALGMRDGPESGLAAIEAVLESGALERYPLLHAARADMQRRLGRDDAARQSYASALALTHQPAERRFLERRLAQLSAS